jgi:hypothetical protein
MSAALQKTKSPLKKWLSRIFGQSRRIESWQQYVPMTKEQAMEILKRDLPSDVEIDLKVKSDGSGSISIQSRGIDESRDFNLKDGVVYQGWMEVTEAHRGIGRHIMRNEIEFFSACGAKKYEIYAALSAGGYTWARFGFLPDNIDSLKKDVQRRYERLKLLLDDQEKILIQDVLKFSDAKDIWSLADTRIDLGPRLRDIFKKAAAGDKAAEEKCEEINMMEYPVKDELDSGKPQPVGRLLLAGIKWYGHLNFKDKEQMKRAGQYVGGWHPLPGV